ncbi:MAG: class A beta-lactamase-related serine hydrolase [Pedobacter sp.]|nr:MAG: class A beta-lactamase-related serine hydrolase [Pedobacter sp.]
MIAGASPSLDNEAISKFNYIFSEWENTSDKPGVAAGLIKNGKVVFLKGFGTADVTHQSPVTVNTKFQIGAMSKQFTAFAILLLEEQGKLSLSDDVRKYIPQLPEYGYSLTIKHLLSQSSGLSDFLALKEIAGWRGKDIFTQQDALNLISQQKYLEYIPGTKFSQTSSGFILLAEVVKQVTGQSLANFSKEHIFAPLGMSSTLFYDDHEMIIPDMAVSYHIEKNVLKNNHISYSIIGSTNLYTSVSDLSRWYLNFEQPRVGSKELIRKMTSPVTLNDDQTTYNPTAGRLLYGQQFQHAERGVPKIWTYGLEGGFASNIFIFPQQGVTSFVLGNNNRYNGSLAMNMAVEILGDVFPQPSNIDFRNLKTVKQTNQQLQTFIGDYWDDEHAAALSIYLQNDTLRFKSTGNAEKYSLLPIAESTYQMMLNGDDRVLVKFQKQGGSMKLVYTSGESDEYVYKRYKPSNYPPVVISSFTGIFYNKALNSTYILSQNSKGLFTSNKSQPIINFTSIQKQTFLSTSRNLGSIRFAWDKDHNVRGFYVNSERVRGLFFEKVQKLK